jgi:hypothetical protein
MTPSPSPQAGARLNLEDAMDQDKRDMLDDYAPDEGPEEEISNEEASGPPGSSRKVRQRRRDRARSKTIAPKRLTKEELRMGALLAPMDDIKRPVTRADCLDGPRPCPWVSCKHHLFLDVNPETGSIKLNFPDQDVWDMKDTCSLDVADRGGITLEDVGEILNLTRERIRQVEVRGLLKLKMIGPEADFDDDSSC